MFLPTLLFSKTFIDEHQWITYLPHLSSASTLFNYNFASGGATTDASLVRRRFYSPAKMISPSSQRT
jgi:hypothetical protein